MKWDMSVSIENMYALACEAHKGQFRKGTKVPYIIHPERVATIIFNTVFEKISNEIKEDMIAAALGHDILEDTGITELEILKASNENVLNLIKELTNPSKNFVPTEEHFRLPKGSIRKIKKQIDRDHLLNVSYPAKIIKLADRLDNVRDMNGMDDDFCLLYADESQLLLNTLKGTYVPFEILLENEIFNLRRKVKERKEN